jgi:ribose transport system ATP-binding protein
MNIQHPAKPIDHSGASPHQDRARLSVRGVGKSFAGIQVLSGIELEVYEGEVLAVVGENGA